MREPNGRYEPGYSGNPFGRPKGAKGLSLTARIRRALDEPDSKDPHITAGEAVVASLIRLAKEGDIAAIKLLIDRADGHKAGPPLDPRLEEVISGMFD